MTGGNGTTEGLRVAHLTTSDMSLALLLPAATLQVLMPLQAPLQPAKTLPAAAWAVSVTAVLLAKVA